MNLFFVIPFLFSVDMCDGKKACAWKVTGRFFALALSGSCFVCCDVLLACFQYLLTFSIRIVAVCATRNFQATTKFNAGYNVHIYYCFGYYFYTLLATFILLFSSFYLFQYLMNLIPHLQLIQVFEKLNHLFCFQKNQLMKW